jgi:hypothetical protein
VESAKAEPAGDAWAIEGRGLHITGYRQVKTAAMEIPNTAVVASILRWIDRRRSISSTRRITRSAKSAGSRTLSAGRETFEVMLGSL